MAGPPGPAKGPPEDKLHVPAIQAELLLWDSLIAVVSASGAASL